MERGRRYELVAYALFLSVALVLGGAATLIEPSPFDPIGSGRFPLALSLLLGCAVVVLTVQSFVRVSPDADELDDDAKTDNGGGYDGMRVLAILLLAAIYVASLSNGWLAFMPLSGAYVLATGLLLAGKECRWPTMLGLLAMGAMLSGLLTYVFTHILYLRLP